MSIGENSESDLIVLRSLVWRESYLSPVIAFRCVQTYVGAGLKTQWGR